MPDNSKLLRTLPCGLKLYLCTTAEKGKWKRVPGLTDEEYFSKFVGGRVGDEAAKHVAMVMAKSGKVPDRVVIEDGFHHSDSDEVSHAGVVYEDSNGNHLGKKHIVETPEEQAKSDQRTGK